MTKAAVHDESGMIVDAASEDGDKMDTDVKDENAESKANDSSGNEHEINDATPIEQVFPLFLHLLGAHCQNFLSLVIGKALIVMLCCLYFPAYMSLFYILFYVHFFVRF